MIDDAFFEKAFHDLTDHGPFPWQQELFKCFIQGKIPRSCQIPTGLGKTAIIPIWLIALARSVDDQGAFGRLPRRLVYIVNRRTVVDQATNEAETIRKRLQTQESLLDLSKRLKSLCALQVDVPLAISTLRGQFADNREWSADPSRPAIILGTVDMIGSRLLFSGYGLGFKSKPLHAGFLGQDALLVHDEAHLEPAFQRLLVAVKAEQERCKDLQPFHMMELSATSRERHDANEVGAESAECDVLRLTAKDRNHPEIKKRIQAKKAVVLHPIEDKAQLVDRLFDLAFEHKDSNRAILVFAQTVEAVEKTAKKLRDKSQEVVTLTGTMRGKERDELVKRAVFQRFLPGASPGGKAVYLICTGAGEVGINISADHIVCDLSTFESMAQRFGRVNRFGSRDDTRIDIVHPKEFEPKDENGSRLKKTLELLGKLDDDGSPEALDKLDADDRIAAFSPAPAIPLTSDILFDAWALTSVKGKMPGRPPVEPYLHGVSSHEPPETYVAWREEVGVVTVPLQDRYKPADLLADYPLKPHELLRDRSDRVFKHLASLAAKHPRQPAWLLDDDGTVEVLKLDDLVDKDRKDRIDHRTVLLPSTIHGLRDGLLTSDPEDVEHDVADNWLDDQDRQRRSRTWEDLVPDEMRLLRIIDTKLDREDEEETEVEASGGRFWSWYVRPKSADGDESKTGRRAVLWDVHTEDVTGNAQRIVKNLPLTDDEKKAVIAAARYHDLGKKRTVWQRSIGNPNPTRWLAKSGGKMKPIELTDYRHEFGSLLDALDQPDFAHLNEDQKEIVLHLIAVHHGCGRPRFWTEVAFDLEPKGRDVDSMIPEVPRRFARLQRKYGRWGLAYLESLLRAADYAASASPSDFVNDEQEDGR